MPQKLVAKIKKTALALITSSYFLKLISEIWLHIYLFKIRHFIGFIYVSEKNNRFDIKLNANSRCKINHRMIKYHG